MNLPTGNDGMQPDFPQQGTLSDLQPHSRAA